MKYAIARCSLGALGLITTDDQVTVVYKDETQGRAWQGIHLEERDLTLPDGRVEHVRPGDEWLSRKPKIIRCLAGDEIVIAEMLQFFADQALISEEYLKNAEEFVDTKRLNASVNRNRKCVAQLVKLVLNGYEASL